MIKNTLVYKKFITVYMWVRQVMKTILKMFLFYKSMVQLQQLHQIEIKTIKTKHKNHIMHHILSNKPNQIVNYHWFSDNGFTSMNQTQCAKFQWLKTH